MAEYPCQQGDWHITPSVPGHAEKAIALCHQCPILKLCATRALRAGDTRDGSWTHPAVDTVYGGVHCPDLPEHDPVAAGRIADETARQLAAVAGVPVPTYRRQKHRNPTPKHCRGCGEPMTARARNGPQPAGTVGHMARGLCVACWSKGKRSPNRDECWDEFTTLDVNSLADDDQLELPVWDERGTA